MTLLVALAGALGAVTRYLVDLGVRRRWPSDVPWATLSINVTGSFLLGVLVGTHLRHGAVLGAGFCGGYTTFSTASAEAVLLARAGRRAAAAGYAAVTAALTVGVAALGLWLAL